MDSYPIQFGVLRKVPGSEYKYTVVASESKTVESAPIGSPSVVRHFSVNPMSVQAGDLIAFGQVPGYNYDGKASLSGFFAIGVGGYEDDLGYGCLQMIANGATLQCWGPLNSVAANDGDISGTDWISLRLLMNADFEPASAPPPPPTGRIRWTGLQSNRLQGDFEDIQNGRGKVHAEQGRAGRDRCESVRQGHRRCSPEDQWRRQEVARQRQEGETSDSAQADQAQRGQDQKEQAAPDQSRQGHS